ncbi:MAG: hypothetical protein J6K03_05565 [Oscillospiraceae bacterium]|nr:hypothetical protein [Oscillospiraceae bacterium]
MIRIDNRVLLAAVIIYEDKRDHFYKKYIKEVPNPDTFEEETISDSSNKEIYLYVFYILNDIERIKLCLNVGANPNILYRELNYIVKDRGIYTADPSYNSHDGYSTVFFDAVYKRNYDLVEIMLKSGASFYPEKVCPIKTNWASACANPARCAAMARIMQENDLKMLQLIAEYIPDVVNIEFSERTEREAYDCLSKIDFEFGALYAGGIQTPLSYCIEYDTGDYYKRTTSSSLFKGCAFKPIDSVLNKGEHRYLETAKWLVANGADVTATFDTVDFHSDGTITAEYMSLLACAMSRSNYDMTALLVGTGNIPPHRLSEATYYSKDKNITALAIACGAEDRSQKTSRGGCYIATAVYGSYDCPEVWTLRRFRDDYLQKYIWGRLFIRVYYAVSPTIVRLFGSFRAFNRINREILDRLTAALKLSGYSDKPYDDN